MLIYLEDMEKCLGVIPNSHHDLNSFNYNSTDPIDNLLCNKGDAIFFNANLIHAGALNKQDDHLRIQLKISHKNDFEAIKYYNNYNKILDQDNNLPFFLKKAHRKLSCMFPFISNFTQTEIQETSGGKKISIYQKIYSFIMYGNSNFYDLSDAF